MPEMAYSVHLKKTMLNQLGSGFSSPQEALWLKKENKNLFSPSNLKGKIFTHSMGQILKGFVIHFCCIGDAKHRRNLHTCTAEKISVAAVHVASWREGRGSGYFVARISSFEQHTKALEPVAEQGAMGNVH